jgi:hypothetical protein
MNALFVAALFLAPATALARPMVWLHVPDASMQRIESADRELFSARARVERTKHDLVSTRADREDVKARRRDAKAERMLARKDLKAARRDLRDAWKAGDDQVTSTRTHRYIDALEDVDEAREHIRWHTALMGVNRAEAAEDKARISHAVALLEFEQSILLDRNGRRFVYGPSSFEKQAAQMERKIEARASEVDIALSVASDVKTEYVASNF